MADRPIIFSAPMCRAILEGRKSMTRRVLKPQPPEWCTNNGVSDLTPPGYWEFRGRYEDHSASKFIKCPYLPVSETRLWVRETWADNAQAGADDQGIVYRATDPEWSTCDGWKWRPSICMPRIASRFTLQPVCVRAERLQDITEDDAESEGFLCDDYHGSDPTDRSKYCGGVLAFRKVWDALNAKRGFPWESNPWVWVVEFKRC